MSYDCVCQHSCHNRGMKADHKAHDTTLQGTSDLTSRRHQLLETVCRIASPYRTGAFPMLATLTGIISQGQDFVHVDINRSWQYAALLHKQDQKSTSAIAASGLAHTILCQHSHLRSTKQLRTTNQKAQEEARIQASLSIIHSSHSLRYAMIRYACNHHHSHSLRSDADADVAWRQSGRITITPPPH